MALTDAQIKTLIINTIGDVSVAGRPVYSGGVLEENYDLIWASHAGQSVALRTLLTKRDCIELVLFRVAHRVNTQVGNIQVSKSQTARTLSQMREKVLEDIKIAERSGRVGGVLRPILVTSPVTVEDQPRFIREID